MGWGVLSVILLIMAFDFLSCTIFFSSLFVFNLTTIRTVPSCFKSDLCWYNFDLVPLNISVEE